MGTPTVNEVMQRIAAKYAKDELFTGQPTLRALVHALATVLVGRDDDAAMQQTAGVVLHALLPSRAKPAPRLMRLAEEMARRMFAPEEPCGALREFIGEDVVEHLKVTTDLDGIVAELRAVAHPKETRRG